MHPGSDRFRGHARDMLEPQTGVPRKTLESIRRSLVIWASSFIGCAMYRPRPSASLQELVAPVKLDSAFCDDSCLEEIFGAFEDPEDGATGQLQQGPSETVADTYGTITALGVRTICAYLDIKPSDVFTDIGSGIGNVVLQICCSTPVKKARGIEYVKSRHLRAVRNLQSFQTKYSTEPGRELSLVNGDAFQLDFSDSTIVFASSTALTSGSWNA